MVRGSKCESLTPIRGSDRIVPSLAIHEHVLAKKWSTENDNIQNTTLGKHLIHFNKATSHWVAMLYIDY